MARGEINAVVVGRGPHRRERRRRQQDRDLHRGRPREGARHPVLRGGARSRPSTSRPPPAPASRSRSAPAEEVTHVAGRRVAPEGVARPQPRLRRHARTATSRPSSASGASRGRPTRRACARSPALWPRRESSRVALVLGIETSCDETAAAVVEDGRRILSNVVSSQVAIHAPYGGVVPELASRHHIENIVPVIESAMTESGAGFPDLAAVAVTQGPGLVGSLLVGVQAAKAIALVHGKPLVPVHHVAGHVAAAFLAHGEHPAPRDRPRRLRRAHEPLRPARGGRLPAPRADAGRRGRRGVRQGGEAPGPRLPRRAGHRSARGRGERRGGGAAHRAHQGRAGGLLLQRRQDGGAAPREARGHPAGVRPRPTCRPACGTSWPRSRGRS